MGTEWVGWKVGDDSFEEGHISTQLREILPIIREEQARGGATAGGFAGS